MKKVQKSSISLKSCFWTCDDAEGSHWGLAFWSWFWYFHWSLVHHCSEVWLFWRCKEHPCPLNPHLGLWRMPDVPYWGLEPWSWFGYGHWSLIFPLSEFWLTILILKVQRTSMSFKSSFGFWRTLEVLDWGLESLSWLEYGQWSLVHPFSEWLLLILVLKVQRTCQSHKFSFGALEDAECSWLEFGIFILLWIWSLVSDVPKIQILALYLDFEGAKNIHVL